MTFSFATSMKKHGITLLGVGLMFLGALWLVTFTDTNVVTRDQWGFLTIIDHYEKSALTFNDIWQGHSIHRMPMYKILFLLDAIWFHLNVLLESYAGVLSLAVSALYLYSRYSGTFAREASQATIQFSFLVLCAVLFSFNQWALYIYPLSSLDSFLGNLCFIAAWFYLDRELDKPESSLFFEIGFAVIFTLMLLCFGEGMTPAIIATTLLVMALKNISKNGTRVRSAWRFFAIMCCASVITVLLYLGVGEQVSDSDFVSMFGQLLKNIPGDVIYVLYAMELSVVSTFTNAHFPEYLDYLIGFVILLCYVGAFWLYWRERMIQKVRMPLFLMVYSLLYLGLILMGRFRLPVTQQVSPFPRYVTELQLGIIGVVWIFYYWGLPTASSKLPMRSVARFVVAMMTVCLVTAETLGALGAIKTAPYQRAGIRKFQEVLLSGKLNEKEIDPAAIFYCPSARLCFDGAKILRDYNLAPFDREAQHPIK